MAAVFISYKQPDRQAAERICSSLEAAGIGCWMAPRDIPPGTEWPAAVMQGIRGAKTMVLLLSAESHSDKQICREVENADHLGLNIITFRLSNVSPPDSLAYFLRNLQWLDAFDGRFEEAVHQLANTVRRVQATTATPVATASTSVATPQSSPEPSPQPPPIAQPEETPPIMPQAATPSSATPETGSTRSSVPYTGIVVGVFVAIAAIGAGWYFTQSHAISQDNTPIDSNTAIQLRDSAIAEWRSGNRNQAIRDISNLIVRDPGLPQLYLIRGEWEEMQGATQAALNDFDTCLARNPEKAGVRREALLHRGQVKGQLGDAAGSQADRDAAKSAGGGQ